MWNERHEKVAQRLPNTAFRQSNIELYNRMSTDAKHSNRKRFPEKVSKLKKEN